MRFSGSLILSTCLFSRVFCMGISFENIYFKFLPTIPTTLPVQEILRKAVSHDMHGNGVYPPGKQKEFVKFLITKKKLTFQKYMHEWQTAFFYAAQTGNAEGVQILKENGVDSSHNQFLISVVTQGWLARKQIKNNREQQIDLAYKDILKQLLSCGFCPDIATADRFPLQLAIIHNGKMPGLLTLLITHSNPVPVYNLLNLHHKFILRSELEKIERRVSDLAKDKTTYFSLLVSGLLEMVSAQYFIHADFLKEITAR